MTVEKYIITSEQINGEMFGCLTMESLNKIRSNKLSTELKKYRKQILKEAINLILDLPEDPYCHAGRSEMEGHADCLKILRNMVKKNG